MGVASMVNGAAIVRMMVCEAVEQAMAKERAGERSYFVVAMPVARRGTTSCCKSARS